MAKEIDGIEYNIVRSENATKPRIDVDIHEVKVVIPQNSDLEPDELVKENIEWIKEKKSKYNKYREEAPERKFEEGEEFPFLGEEKKVKLEDTRRNKVDNNFILSKKKVEKNDIKTELEKLYRKEAKRIFKEKSDQYAEKMGVTFNKILIWNQRTRWASCSPKENLSYNWRAIMAPEEIVEYLVIHELTHLKERNHTKRFWRIVKSHNPDYKKHAEWLKENSSKLIFTKDDL